MSASLTVASSLALITTYIYVSPVCPVYVYVHMHMHMYVYVYVYVCVRVCACVCKGLP